MADKRSNNILRVTILLLTTVMAASCVVREQSEIIPDATAEQYDEMAARQRDLATEQPTPTPPLTARTEINASVGAVELIWEVPVEHVDGFEIRYGFSEDRVDQVVRLTVAELERTRDPQHGYIYRYVISHIPHDKTIFISLLSYAQDSYSQPSQVVRVDP